MPPTGTLIAGTPKTKLTNNDENVLPELVGRQKVKDDSEKQKEPNDRAVSAGGDPQSVSPSNIGVTGKPTKKVLEDHPTADSEVTFAANAPNSSHISDPKTAAKFAKRARIEGRADGQRQRVSTWWHPTGRVVDGTHETRDNDGEVKEDKDASKVNEYNHW